MHQKRLIYLSEKIIAGNITDAELDEFNDWYISKDTEEFHIKSHQSREALAREMYQQIAERSGLRIASKAKTLGLWPRIAIAVAVAVIVFGAGLFYYTLNADRGQPGQLVYKNDVAPGKTGATLTLASGKKIYLANVKTGDIANESGVSITKTSGGQIVYTVKESNTSNDAINTLETSRGEQSQVKLPDGSVVFLNAASSLKYPASFAASKERTVFLTGEGYFEVAKDKDHPFIVNAKGQQVRVLGTHFNINAYNDEPEVKTTLLEGSVLVAPVNQNSLVTLSLSKGVTLKPGSQSVLPIGGQLSVQKVDASTAIAWKNGEFVFERENITSIMRKIARWYNVEILYEGDVEKKGIWGSVSRYGNVSKVLEKLSATGTFTFEIRGRTIIVRPGNK